MQVKDRLIHKPSWDPILAMVAVGIGPLKSAVRRGGSCR